MSELAWNWLSAPYFACAVVLLAVSVIGALIRGDRVLRLGVVGATTTTLPWAICSGLSACSHDPETATRLLRLGLGPIALVGPNLLLVLLGVSGQLERYRWLARISGVVGVVLLALCWGTDWTVPGVQELPTGLLYTRAGPLTDFHISQLAIWLAIGIWIVRRATSRGEKRRLMRLMIALLSLGGVGAMDMLIVHGVWGSYPIAWLPALGAAVLTLYMVLYTDLLRPQGIDRGVGAEVLAFLISAVVIAIVANLLDGEHPLALAAVAAITWAAGLGASWAFGSQRPVRVAGERALEEFVSRLSDVDDEKVIAARLAALWAQIAIEVRATYRAEGETFVEVTTGEAWPLSKEVAGWLVERAQPVAPTDLSTIRLGALRPQLEALVTAHGATLIIPLLDRGELVGLVEADHEEALRDEERGMVGVAARAAARALTYAALARAAATEGASAREVEVAEAMRLQASASRDDELGRWTVAAEYRTAPRTTGAGWSTTLLADGRLAVLVTEAQAHGVAAALATAAVTGAFAAATTGTVPVTLDDLLASLRASADGVMRGGEPIAAFIAVLDADRQRVAWACAGHPGAYIVGPVAYDLSQFPHGSGAGPRPKALVLGGGGGALGASMTTATRGETALPHDSLLVITSTAVRGESEERWAATLREQAPAGPRLATVLVEAALKRGDLHEDFLVVVVRQRPDRRSEPVMAPIG